MFNRAPNSVLATVFALGVSFVVPAAAAPLDLTVRAGKFEEHCVKLAAGDALRYRFKADAPIDFNIHHHRGNEVLYPVRQEQVARLSGKFRAPAADEYCLMWENKSARPITVRGMARP